MATKNQLFCDTCKIKFTEYDNLHQDHDFTLILGEPFNLSDEMIKMLLHKKNIK